ncbi:MAG: hypothetical protein H8D78_19475 [Chloroflexi bacterium]|nr:hypothetical protein [Chloroflexota bacterium]
MVVEMPVLVRDQVIKYVETRAQQERKSRPEMLGALIEEWYELQVQRLHEEYLRGDITLRGMTARLGLSYRELFRLMEERGLSF